MSKKFSLKDIIFMLAGAVCAVGCALYFKVFSSRSFLYLLVSVMTPVLGLLGGLYQLRSGLREKLITGAYSLALSLVMLFHRHVARAAEWTYRIDSIYLTPLDGYDILPFMLSLAGLYAVTSGAVMLMDLFQSAIKGQNGIRKRLFAPVSGKKVFLISFFALMIGWGMCWMTYFPGTAFHDNMWILNDYKGVSGAHPWFYCLVLEHIFRLGDLIGGTDNTGAVLLSLFQLNFNALIVSYLIYYLSKKRCPALLLCGLLAYFALSPNMANIALAGWKDSPFAFASLLPLPFLYELCVTGGESSRRPGQMLLFFIGSALIILLRTNGLFVMIGTAPFIVLAFRKHWKRLLPLVLIAVILPYSLDYYGTHSIAGRSRSNVEMLSVPLQQLGRTGIERVNLTDDELNEINEKIFPVDEIKNYYNPHVTDGLKHEAGGRLMNKEYILNNLSGVLDLWLRLLPRNLGSYMKAYVFLNYGYWTPGEPADAQDFLTGYPEYSEQFSRYISKVQLFGDSTQQALEDHFLTKRVYPGNILWALIFLMAFLAIRRRYRLWTLFLPCIMLFLTLMISSPANRILRYFYMPYISLPFLMLFALLPMEGAADAGGVRTSAGGFLSSILRPAPEGKSASGRLPWIDLARFSAILMVVLCHAKDATLGKVADASMSIKVFALTMSTIGRIGVPFFLMITGFLLLDREYTPEGAKRFWKGSWLYLLLNTAVWFLLYDIFIKVFYDPALSIPVIIKDLFFIHKVNLGHVWYMPMLLGMYLLVPLAANGLRSLNARTLAFPTAVLTLLLFIYPMVNLINNIFGWERIGLQLSSGFSGGVYGMYMAFGYLIKKGTLKRVKAPALAVIAAAAFIVTVWMQIWPYSREYTYNVWYDDIFLLITSLALFELFSRIKHVPLARAAKWFSGYAFGVYLIHMIARYFLLRYLITPSAMSKPAQLLVLWITTVLASFAAAWLIDRIPKVGKFLLYRK